MHKEILKELAKFELSYMLAEKRSTYSEVALRLPRSKYIMDKWFYIIL